MKRGNWEEVLWALDERGLQGAREVFEEQFGVAPDAAEVDGEYIRLFEDALRHDQPPPRVEIPLYLLVALTLREGFGGRGRGPSGRPRQVLYMERRLHALGRKMKENLKQQGTKPGDATEAVVREYFPRSTLSEEEFRSNLGRKKPRL
jgi:hypothetical protein